MFHAVLAHRKMPTLISAKVPLWQELGCLFVPPLRGSLLAGQGVLHISRVLFMGEIGREFPLGTDHSPSWASLTKGSTFSCLKCSSSLQSPDHPPLLFSMATIFFSPFPQASEKKIFVFHLSGSECVVLFVYLLFSNFFFLLWCKRKWRCGINNREEIHTWPQKGAQAVHCTNVRFYWTMMWYAEWGLQPSKNAFFDLTSLIVSFTLMHRESDILWAPKIPIWITWFSHYLTKQLWSNLYLWKESYNILLIEFSEKEMRSYINCLLWIRCSINTIFPEALCWLKEWLTISLWALFT